MEKRLAIWLFVLLTAAIAACAIWIAWMLTQFSPKEQVFTNAYLVREVLHAAI